MGGQPCVKLGELRLSTRALCFYLFDFLSLITWGDWAELDTLGCKTAGSECVKQNWVLWDFNPTTSFLPGEPPVCVFSSSRQPFNPAL